MCQTSCIIQLPNTLKVDCAHLYRSTFIHRLRTNCSREIRMFIYIYTDLSVPPLARDPGDISQGSLSPAYLILILQLSKLKQTDFKESMFIVFTMFVNDAKRELTIVTCKFVIYYFNNSAVTLYIYT